MNRTHPQYLGLLPGLFFVSRQVSSTTLDLIGLSKASVGISKSKNRCKMTLNWIVPSVVAVDLSCFKRRRAKLIGRQSGHKMQRLHDANQQIFQIAPQFSIPTSQQSDSDISLSLKSATAVMT